MEPNPGIDGEEDPPAGGAPPVDLGAAPMPPPAPGAAHCEQGPATVPQQRANRKRKRKREAAVSEAAACTAPPRTPSSATFAPRRPSRRAWITGAFRQPHAATRR